MLRKGKDSASVAIGGSLVPVNTRPEVRAAAQRVADAAAHFEQMERELSGAVQALESIEHLAGAEWKAGADLPTGLIAGQSQRMTFESAVRVARHAVEAAKEEYQLVLARARQEFRQELEAEERALAAELDAALVVAGRLNVALVELHYAAHREFGSGHGSRVWSKAFGPLTPDSQGGMPGGVQLWRKILRQQGVLPANGRNEDWEAFCKPVRPVPVVLAGVTPVVAPPNVPERLARIDENAEVAREPRSERAS